MLDNMGVPRWAIEEAEKAANSIFEGTLELVKWSIERRRQLACWRAVKLAEIIYRVNRWRLSQGKKPRKMWLQHRRLIVAQAECEANRREHPELAIVCGEADRRIALLEQQGRPTIESKV